MILRVGGVRAGGAGYPNADETLRLLGSMAQVEILECGTRLPDSLHLWRLARAPVVVKVAGFVRLLVLNLASLVRVACVKYRRSPLVYVPYPAVFFLWLVSCLPHRMHPCCIADGYISVWDSLFRDRAAGSQESLIARILKRIEARALRAAALVLVDTEANREVFIKEFGLEPGKVRSLPLAIDERHFTAALHRAPSQPRAGIRVLFVGTLIPLHGIGVILDAMTDLVADSRFKFRLIGNGQQAGSVADFVAAHPDVPLTWITEWCSLDRIASEIAAADICLGVFGGSGKAARVLPFKLYMYLAAGRAVISQAALSTPLGVPPPPVKRLEGATGMTLASAIRELADQPTERSKMQQEAAEYYQRWLSNARVVASWKDILDKLPRMTR